MADRDPGTEPSQVFSPRPSDDKVIRPNQADVLDVTVGKPQIISIIVPLAGPMVLHAPIILVQVIGY
jgi:hypothetical protein